MLKFFKKIFLKLPIRYKISIIMILLVASSIILISRILYVKEKAIILEEMKKRGNIISKNLANAGFEAIVNKDKLVSSDVITEIMKDKSIVYCTILNQANRIIDSSVLKHINRYYVDKYSKQLKTIEDLSYFNITYEDKDVLDVVRPIVVEYKDKRIKKGYVRVGMDWEAIDQEINKAMWSILILALFFLIITVTISLYFAKSITDPILKIVSVMEKVGKGDLEQRVEISLIDEIGKLANTFNEMIRHLQEKLMMSKYMSKSTIDMISKKDDGKLELGGKRKHVTLFFSDIRGFTAYSETKTPEEVISMLNKYLRIQADIIDKNKGSIDKFVGDEVVAVFEGSSMVENAIKSSILIQNKITDLNKASKDRIAIGIGINTGEVVMGNMGSEKRMDYTVIGDNVNTASRLCSNARPTQIIVSESGYLLAKKKFKFKGPLALTVKGKKDALRVYEVIY